MAFPRNWHRYLGVALALGAALPSAAMPAPPDLAAAQVLDASSLITQVLERNPGLGALRAAAEAAAQRSAAAGALDDPILSYGAAPQTLGSGLEQRIEIGQKFPWPGTLDASAAVARHAAAATAGDLESLRLDVIAQAKTALAEWRFVAEALEIHHATRALLDELTASAASRYAAGQALQQDVLQAEVERANLDNEAQRLRRLETTVQARINALLNRPPHAPLPPAAPLTALPQPPPLEALAAQSLARHPELERLAARVSARQSRIALAEKAFYPDFQIGVGYNRLWEDPDKRPILNLSLNLPLDRGKRQAELNAARADASAAQWTLAQRRAELLADLARARAEAVAARQSVERHQDELVPLADEYLSAAIAGYQSGAGAFPSVIAAEQFKLATDLALARARADFAIGLAELERWAATRFDAPQDQNSGAQP